LFEEYNINLVCESDHHALKRTVPIRNGKPAADGIIYIGDGGLGVPQRKPDLGRWFLQAPGLATSVHHVHVLEFGKDTLRVRAIGLKQDVLDDFSLAPVLVPAGVGR
jgi:hypothetical protein